MLDWYGIGIGRTGDRALPTSIFAYNIATLLLATCSASPLTFLFSFPGMAPYRLLIRAYKYEEEKKDTLFTIYPSFQHVHVHQYLS